MTAPASCGAPAGGYSIEGVDVAKETVIQGAVSRDAPGGQLTSFSTGTPTRLPHSVHEPS